MRIFQFTSTTFEGVVELYFNDLGLLEKFDASQASLSEHQQIWLLKHMPRELAELKRILGNNGTAKLTEVTEEVTFEMFWNRYDDKIMSSRKRALAKWEKMSKTERIKAYKYIGTYFASLPSNTRKKYAETYLNAELWNN